MMGMKSSGPTSAPVALASIANVVGTQVGPDCLICFKSRSSKNGPSGSFSSAASHKGALEFGFHRRLIPSPPQNHLAMMVILHVDGFAFPHAFLEILHSNFLIFSVDLNMYRSRFNHLCDCNYHIYYIFLYHSYQLTGTPNLGLHPPGQFSSIHCALSTASTSL